MIEPPNEQTLYPDKTPFVILNVERSLIDPRGFFSGTKNRWGASHKSLALARVGSKGPTPRFGLKNPRQMSLWTGPLKVTVSRCIDMRDFNAAWGKRSRDLRAGRRIRRSLPDRRLGIPCLFDCRGART